MNAQNQRILLITVCCVFAIALGLVFQYPAAAQNQQTQTKPETKKPAPPQDALVEKVEVVSPQQAAQKAPTLVANPSAIRFTSTRQETKITVTKNGALVPQDTLSAAIAGSYGWMFEIQKPKDAPGVILLRTNPDNCEYGSYELIVKSGEDQTKVDVYVTLADEQPTVANPEGYQVLPLRTKESYVQGTVLTLTVNGPDDAVYVWSLNGKEVEKGPGKKTATIKLDTEGPATVRITATQNSTKVLETSMMFEVLPAAATP